MSTPAALLPSEGVRRDPWRSGRLGWVATVDHKRIGILYLIITLFFFLVGGVEALLMRLQLAQPNGQLLSPHSYNEVFTMHGITMIFLVVMPALIGLSNYVVPLMIGARNVAFPRLNAFSVWILLFGGLLLYYSFLAGGAPDAGWISFAPLSEIAYNVGPGPDYWALGLFVLAIGSVATAINFIVTILRMRAPGMTPGRLPLFVWVTLVSSFLILVALPVLGAVAAMLFLDRNLGTYFFQPDAGGSALLWQHLFRAFGQPGVYIMVLPAFGIISEVIPVFSRKPIYGYAFMAASTLAIGVLCFGLWAADLLAGGLGRSMHLVVAAISMLVAIPAGVKIFNWTATLYGGSIRLTTSMLFALAFLIQFTIGGLSALMSTTVPVGWQLTGTDFMVAQLHYVLVGGTFFALMAGAYYWFPKMSGRLLSERLGRWHFWLMVIGVNTTFMVQYLLGLMGMRRRVYTYPNLPGWGALNLVSTIGAFIVALSVLLFLVNIAWSLRRGAKAGDNPWQAWSLEWATTSPPPIHNFERVPPVTSRRPLRTLAHSGGHPRRDVGPDGSQ
ncbi:MAG: cbb3-type cytochrome c oxidase subunit I [Gemmatimonadota bacterium]|jgi:cytochrome c oxidase subunit I